MNSSVAAIETELQNARNLLTQGQADRAGEIYARVVASAPDNIEALLFLAMQALGSDQTSRAIELLDRGVALEPLNSQFHFGLGLAYSSVQRMDEALIAFGKAVELAPNFFIARLHYGQMLESAGREHEALTNYFQAINQAQAKGRWLSAETTATKLQELVRHAMDFVDAGRRSLFYAVLEPFRLRHGDDACRRVRKCLDIYLGEKPANYPDQRQRPKFLYFPGLPTTAYFVRELFPWYAELEANTAQIREELLAVLGEKSSLEPFLKINSATDLPQYLAGGPQGAPAWDAFFFYRHGKRYDENCARCPRTSAILDRLPLARIPEHAPEVCFSVLTPGTHILPHRGVTNVRLVTHLPLVVPEDCAINVGGELHAWEEGRCVTFDDTFEHEAWNRGQTTRVVMILDVWNPYLSEVERDAVSELVVAIGKFNQECGLAVD
jgi:aspartyl/asparaginyl beta-hydroxylase (cupin superfamily)/Tfp pilus assembly protein PilF